MLEFFGTQNMRKIDKRIPLNAVHQCVLGSPWKKNATKSAILFLYVFKIKSLGIVL